MTFRNMELVAKYQAALRREQHAIAKAVDADATAALAGQELASARTAVRQAESDLKTALLKGDA